MILVTGGAGYIGSHTCIELLEAGYELVVLDSLCNSSVEALKRVEKITGKTISFVDGDIRDQVVLRSLFTEFEINAVIHFAGLKAVDESVKQSLSYYDNNVAGSITLFKVMAEFGCKRLVFSSSATVYGDPASLPIREDFPLSAANPYGASKLMVENILRDLYSSDCGWVIYILRYFNPIGAHESGLIGEDPNGTPNNLMPFLSQVAVGRREKLCVFGNDYNTPDGTGIRDYIHVVDLAKGHLSALKRLKGSPGLVVVNLGTGRGYSVLQMVKAFEKASGRVVTYEVVARRLGDVAQCYADPSYAKEELGWQAEFGIDKMCDDSWRWQIRNPKGYKV
jgi:UDP-glucose 4-epimerase